MANAAPRAAIARAVREKRRAGAAAVPPGAPMGATDHRDKLLDCFNRALAPAQVSELIGLFEKLEMLDAAGVAAISAELFDDGLIEARHRAEWAGYQVELVLDDQARW